MCSRRATRDLIELNVICTRREGSGALSSSSLGSRCGL